MPCAVKYALIAVSFLLGLVAFPLQGWAQQEIHFPGAGDGYSVSHIDSSEAAPSGYEGRTQKATITAAGRTPATDGRLFIEKITLSTAVKDCPKADGTAEGDGLFAATLDYSDKQGNAGAMVMSANAKFKGKVGDDGFLDGPVKADIDYSFSQSGSFPDASGAIFSPPGIDVQQHVTMDVGVALSTGMPSLSGFTISDLAQGHFANAFSAAAAVAFWGGVYYAVAETKWTQGGCVLVVFDPPSNTREPVPGSQVKVKTQVRTLTGEITKAQLLNARGNHGTVDPGGGPSDAGAPMIFTFTAPNEKPPVDSVKPGFDVDATSRAGNAFANLGGKWVTGLGTDWTGQITYTSTYSGDQGQNELQTWSFSYSTFYMVTVTEGVAAAFGHAEETDNRENRHRALEGGSIVVLPDNSDTSNGSAGGAAKGTVGVDINANTKTYSIRLEVGSIPAGKAVAVGCIRGRCDTTEMPFYVVPDLSMLGGPLDDANHVHGTKTKVTSGLGRIRNGTRTDTIIWDLARKGTTH
jgi:hypothetical protein